MHHCTYSYSYIESYAFSSFIDFRTYHLLRPPSVRPRLSKKFPGRAALRRHRATSVAGATNLVPGKAQKRGDLFIIRPSSQFLVQCSFARVKKECVREPQPCQFVTVPYESDRTLLAARRRPAARLSDRPTDRPATSIVTSINA